LVLLAIAVRVCALFVFQAYSIKSDWAFGYETGQIAESLALGQGYSGPFLKTTEPTAWLMPGYPWIVSIVFKVLGDFSQGAVFAVLGLNILFSSLTIVPLYSLGDKIFGKFTAVLVGTLFVIYPPSIWHAINTIWDTTLFTFLAVHLLLLVTQIRPDLTAVKAGILGLVMGAVALVNAVVLAFYPFVVLWLLCGERTSFAVRFRSCCVLTLVVAFVLSPWVVRNYEVFDQPMLRSNFGVELWLGNNEKTYEDQLAHRSISPIGRHPSINRSEFVEFVELGEVGYASVKYSQATDFIWENVDKFFFLSKLRFSQFWLGDYNKPNDWTGNLNNVSTRLGLITVVKELCHTLPLPFFFIGVFASIKKRQTFLLIAYLFFIPLVYYVTHVSERYRFPVEPVILLFACYGGKVLASFFSQILRNRVDEPELIGVENEKQQWPQTNSRYRWRRFSWFTPL